MRALRPTFLTALLITRTACGGATPPPTESTATESAATESAAADLPTQAEIDAVALAGARNMCPMLVACGNAEYGDLAACEARWVEETVDSISGEQARRPSCARERLDYYHCLMTRPHECAPSSSLRVTPTVIDGCDAVSARLDDCMGPPVEAQVEEEYEDEEGYEDELDSETTEF